MLVALLLHRPQHTDKLRFRNNGRISVINTRRKTSERYSRRIYHGNPFRTLDAVIEDCITYAIDVDAICRLIKSAHNQPQFYHCLEKVTSHKRRLSSQYTTLHAIRITP